MVPREAASLPYDWLRRSLQTLHQAHWHRQVQAVEGTGPVIQRQGQPLLNFASNDYLGLAGDSRLAEAAIAAIQQFGTGATGSRLLSGHRSLHRELECAIAAFKQTEDALVFSSGYLANIGTLTALVGSRDLILADRYNHSSLKNGAVLSGATVLEYAHGDLADLETQLTDRRQTYRRCLIVTDGVFGMDGDLCPLPGILALANRFGAMVMIDEAHSTGVLGKTGAGCAEHFGCQGQPLIQMGTLSKALASLGGYVAGSADLIDFLRNRAPSWIYTTGLSPADTAAAIAALSVLQQEPQRLTQLHDRAQFLRQQLDQLLSSLPGDTLTRLPSDSAIVCLQVPDAETVVQLGQQLQALGCFVSAVRPPTVPVSRLRMSAIATHQESHMTQLVQALGQALAQTLSRR
ncbi:8-amino-7-oxononanoate synthase [Romeria aff. gracilis LEGE 07310]|uniref:8-amino-7-ketopelargonate synthase n=1 Tax=Vasconcelosia minhoensis LEGE 07310 TaxID=915328 RepID=A0A8J7DBC4_9CYAN|nr:8-amino-7-oxononanoate synthase [Romeria gracilis]MBE9076208.1 8-amino-7-oxononanoate synthase [Romeria aff. gracilis LEGE 07310]